ncbi:MAG: MlaD family protein [Nitrospirota bacterium]
MAYLREEIKAGITIITGLLILSGFTILIGGTQFFKDFDIYYIKVMNAAGLETGSQVKLGGVRIGKISDIKPPEGPGERITITINVKKGTKIYKGTKAFVTQVGFVGDIYMQLSVEETTDESLKPGDTIPSMESIDMKVMMAKISNISESLDILLKDMDKLFSEHNIQDFEKMVKETTVMLKELSSILGDNKTEITALLKNSSDTVEKAGKMIESMEKTIKSVGSASDSVKGAVDSQSQNVSELIAVLKEATEELKEALQEIKNKPWSIIHKEGKDRNE